MSTDPTRRFTDRVANYVRYRPGYPPAVFELLRVRAGLTPASVIADVGCGTGLSAEPFLKMGCTVFGIEPNDAMRRAAQEWLGAEPRFHAVRGSAEETTLPAATIDLAVAGQAFHWFDIPKARAEFRRIVRPGGLTVLMWNTRRIDTTPFLRAYEVLLRRDGTDYADTVHTRLGPAALRQFFGSERYEEHVFPNEQRFDREGLIGRTLSASYVPLPGQPGYESLLRGLDELFRDYQEEGRVTFAYDTEVYLGAVA